MASPDASMTPQPAGSAMTDSHRPVAGVAYLVLTTTLFSVQDVLIKMLSGDYAVHQIVFLRSLLALPVICAIVFASEGFRGMRVGHLGLQLARATLGFATYLLYYLSIATMQIAEAAAITFSTPIIVTVLAVWLLKERIGVHRWAAVFIGFLGVLVILRPGVGVFEPAALLALAAAFSYAMVIIITRRLGRTASTGAMSLITGLVFTAGGLILGLTLQGVESTLDHPSVNFFLRPWTWPAEEDFPALAAVGLISGVATFALSQAYRIADSSIVTPFEYSYLPWAVLWGYLFFGGLPGQHTWVGLVLIVGSGLYILHRISLTAKSVRETPAGDRTG